MITYRCPYCQCQFSESEIAEVHFTKLCPRCDGLVEINAHEALGQSRIAYFIALIFLGIFVIGVFSFLGFLGFDIENFDKLNALEHNNLRYYVVLIALVLVICIPCFAVLLLVRKRYIRIRLHIAYCKLKKTGKV